MRHMANRDSGFAGRPDHAANDGLQREPARSLRRVLRPGDHAAPPLAATRCCGTGSSAASCAPIWMSSWPPMAIVGTIQLRSHSAQPAPTGCSHAGAADGHPVAGHAQQLGPKRGIRRQPWVSSRMPAASDRSWSIGWPSSGCRVPLPGTGLGQGHTGAAAGAVDQPGSGTQPPPRWPPRPARRSSRRRAGSGRRSCVAVRPAGSPRCRRSGPLGLQQTGQIHRLLAQPRLGSVCGNKDLVPQLAQPRVVVDDPDHPDQLPQTVGVAVQPRHLRPDLRRRRPVAPALRPAARRPPACGPAGPTPPARCRPRTR